MEVVLVGTGDPLALVPPPARGVVADGTAVSAVKGHMTFVLCSVT